MEKTYFLILGKNLDDQIKEAAKECDITVGEAVGRAIRLLYLVSTNNICSITLDGVEYEILIKGKI